MPFVEDVSTIVVYVAVLEDVNGFYVGQTSHLRRRIRDHRDRIGADATSRYGISGILSMIRCTDYEEANRTEVMVARELRSIGHLCYGPG